MLKTQYHNNETFVIKRKNKQSVEKYVIYMFVLKKWPTNP